MQPLVRMENVRKEFPGVVALKNVSFDIMPGEVHVLLGENGAGKSTLMKILSGVYQPTSGKIIVKGKEFDKLSPEDSYNSGISIIYQELSVVNSLSILENLYIGKLPTKKRFGLSVVDFEEMRRNAEGIVKMIGINRDLDTMVEDISIPEKQQVEIAKALISKADVIIMDEPTSSLTNLEIEHLFKIVEILKAQGKGIVYISHKLNEIMTIGDRVTVLKDGTYIDTKNVSDVTEDDLVRMMVGREIKSTYHNEKDIDFDKEEVLLEVKNLSRKDNKAIDVSFKLRRGEIVGFSGLVGSGRSELMSSIFGAEPIKSGEIYKNGQRVVNSNPYQAIKNGFAMVTENRRETGFMNNFDIKRNISIVPFLKESKGGGLLGLVSNIKEKDMALEQSKSLKVKLANIDQNITELSGGNQQKVILGKWLAANSEVIIFDEPTKGIDVGSKSEIYELMRKLADEGKAVLVVSSELPELLAVSDTINVFREGKIVATFPVKEADEEKLVRAATGE